MSGFISNTFIKPGVSPIDAEVKKIDIDAFGSSAIIKGKATS